MGLGGVATLIAVSLLHYCMSVYFELFGRVEAMVDLRLDSDVVVQYHTLAAILIHHADLGGCRCDTVPSIESGRILYCSPFTHPDSSTKQRDRALCIAHLIRALLTYCLLYTTVITNSF